MLNKKTLFYIFNISIVLFVVAINNFLISYFNLYNSWIFVTTLTFVTAILYFILNKTFIDDIFKIDDKLKEKIEKTMHEINTPVATIQINTEMLHTKLKDPNNIKRLNRIDKSCENLLTLYEDMEYYIKREIDNVQTTKFDLQSLVLGCVEKFDDLKEDINIVVDIKPLTIKTDKNGFEAMVTNLISNAIKHNKTINTITIKLENNILTFQDDGEGISTQDVYQVFNKYFQANEQSEGFGIGLNVVKEFCDEQKLDIKIDSSSSGTAFHINLININKGN